VFETLNNDHVQVWQTCIVWNYFLNVGTSVFGNKEIGRCCPFHFLLYWPQALQSFSFLTPRRQIALSKEEEKKVSWRFKYARRKHYTLKRPDHLRETRVPQLAQGVWESLRRQCDGVPPIVTTVWRFFLKVISPFGLTCSGAAVVGPRLVRGREYVFWWVGCWGAV